MSFTEIDRYIAGALPTSFLRDFYPRAMRRLAEWGLLNAPMLRTTDDGFSILVDRVDSIKWYIHYFGVFEPQITQAWRMLLEPGDAVVDIGGNIGYHAILAAKLVGPTGTVVTFEPSSAIATQLKANVARNDLKQVNVQQMAVADKRGTLDLYHFGANDQGATSTLNRSGHGASETVPTISFKEVLELADPNLIKVIKIDIEGAEKHVLPEVARQSPRLHADCVIFLEISPENAANGQEMIQPLLKQGFHCRSIANEYNPAFYKQKGVVHLSDYAFQTNQIIDLVLTKNPEMFSRMAAHQ